MFTNTQINGYTYASRFIASWVREGGRLSTGTDYGLFKQWLRSMNLSDDDVEKIYFLASNGKMELEYNAKMFLKEHKQ